MQCIALGLFSANLAGCLQLTEFAMSCQCFRRHHHQHRVWRVLTGRTSGNGSFLSSLLLNSSSADTRILFSCTLCTRPKCNLIISSHYLCFLCRMKSDFSKFIYCSSWAERQTDGPQARQRQTGQASRQTNNSVWDEEEEKGLENVSLVASLSHLLVLHFLS